MTNLIDLIEDLEYKCVEAERRMQVYARMKLGEPVSLEDWGKHPKLKGMKSPDVEECYVMARDIVRHVLRYLQIPTTFASNFEKAYKELNRTNDFDLPSWFAKNQWLFDLIVSEIPEWLDVQPETVGEINIVNQTQDDDTSVLQIVTQAAKLIKASNIPESTKILYGDVIIAGKIERKHSRLAYYDLSIDVIYLLSAQIKKYSANAVQGLIHEFGHRLWRKFIATDVKSAWNTYHNSIKNKPLQVKLPKPGDKLDVFIGSPTVIRVVPGQGIYIDSVKTPVVDFDAWLEIEKKRLRTQSFPTPYSATSAEEHFCEAFALYCMGTLDATHTESFKAITL